MKLYRKRGPDIYFYFKPLVGLLIIVLTVLLIMLFIDGRLTQEQDIQDKMANLSTKEAAVLVSMYEQADLPGIREARDSVTRYDMEQERKKKEWLDAQEKRVAAKKKKEAKEKERKAREDAKARILKLAKANTARTYHGPYNGAVLSRGAGTITGPSGKETYYNLNMAVCVRIMRRMGFSEAAYPYKVRADGVKTLGGYVMVAANLNIRPRGSFIMTSRGVGIVVDTGGFARRNPTQLDLCVNW